MFKVAHHGRRTSSLSGFLDSISPMDAVISLDEDDRFGHPRGETVEALRQPLPNEPYHLTRDRGTIEFIANGEGLWVKT